MFLRRILSGAAALTLLATGGVLMAPSASAAVDCDSVVVDGAGVLGNAVSRVEDAANALRSRGADVRVRTVSNGMNVDEYEQQLVASCQDWQGTDDMFKSSMVVFLVTIKPNGLLFDWGRQFDPYFQDGGAYSQSEIQGAMFDQMHAGNISQGFIAGINKAVEGIDNNGEAPASGEAPVSDSGSGSHGPSVAPKVVGIIVGAFVLLVLLGVLIWWLRERSRANEERKAMQQRALRARDAASKINQELGDPAKKAVRKAKVAKYSAVSSDIARRLDEADDTVDDGYTASTDAFNSAAADGSGPDMDGLTVSEYESMAIRYEEALEHSQTAQAAAQLINDVCREADEQLGKAEATISSYEERVGKLQAILEQLSQQGIRVDAIQTSLDEAQQSLQTAQGHLGQLAVLSDLDEARHDLEEGEAAEQTLAEQRAALTDGLPALQARITQATSLMDPAKECFDRISSGYAESSWESVQGNGTEAFKRIQAAEAILAEATSDATMESQQWEAAVSKMEEGNRFLDDAESFLRSITQLESNLAQAKEQAPQEIRDAETDIVKAEQFIASNDADIDETLEDSLRQARQLADQAQSEFEQDKPDYLRVVKLALEANRNADSIYELAANQHEAAERLRRQAVSALSGASAAVSKAEEYITDHASDIGSGAKQDLGQAKAFLSQAKEATDPAVVLKKATQAQTNADSAYDKARRAFRRAQERYASSTSSSYGSSFGTGVVIGSSSSYGSSGGFGGWGSSGGGGHSHGGGIGFGGGGGHSSGGGISFGGGGGHHHGGGRGF